MDYRQVNILTLLLCINEKAHARQAIIGAERAEQN